MRRTDREITDRTEILEIMKKCDSCSVAFVDEVYPYIVPMNFGVQVINDEIHLYFHGAKAGTKLRLLQKNPHVGFEMSTSHKLLLGDVACDTTMEYESVCGNGEIRLLEEEHVLQAMTALMNQYQPRKEHIFDPQMMKSIMVLDLKVNEIHGKRLKK